MNQHIWQARSADVMSEVLDGEAVIVDLASGRYHAAPGVAATIWQTISAGASMDGIVAEVGRRHTGVPHDAGDHIRRFMDQLVGAGLAAEQEGERPAAPPAASPEPGATPWSAPVLESHDDLQDLLLLDPVHEVSEAGWPHAAPRP